MTDRLSTDQAPAGWNPMESAPKDGTKIQLFCRHMNHRYCTTDKERAKWEGPVEGYWTDFNGGGWVWYGHCGEMLGWKPLASTDSAGA
jgi:hypothetical protein